MRHYLFIGGDDSAIIEAIKVRPSHFHCVMTPFMHLLWYAGDGFDHGDGFLDQRIGIAVDIGVGGEVECHVVEEQGDSLAVAVIGVDMQPAIDV